MHQFKFVRDGNTPHNQELFRKMLHITLTMDLQAGPRRDSSVNELDSTLRKSAVAVAVPGVHSCVMTYAKLIDTG